MKNIIVLFLILVFIQGCSTNPNKKVKNFPISIIKKIIVGID